MSLDINAKLDSLLALPAENEVVEFKEAKNSYDFTKLGKYFSALCNEANLKSVPAAWLVFGVNDRRQVVGSNFRLVRKDLDHLKGEIASKTTNHITFVEIHEVTRPEGRVVMLGFPLPPEGCLSPLMGTITGAMGKRWAP